MTLEQFRQLVKVDHRTSLVRQVGRCFVVSEQVPAPKTPEERKLAEGTDGWTHLIHGPEGERIELVQTFAAAIKRVKALGLFAPLTEVVADDDAELEVSPELDTEDDPQQ